MYRDTVFIAPQNLLAKQLMLASRKKIHKKRSEEGERKCQNPTKIIYIVYFALADQMVSVCCISCKVPPECIRLV